MQEGNNLVTRFSRYVLGPPSEHRWLDNYPGAMRAAFVIAATTMVVYSIIYLLLYASVVTDDNLYVSANGGARVIEVFPNGASDRAGLQVDDLIIAVNGQPVKDSFEAMKYIVEGVEGKILVYTVRRGKQTVDIEIVLAELGIPLITIILFTTGVLSIVLGVFVGIKRPALGDGRLFATALLLGGFSLTLFYGRSPLYFIGTHAAWRNFLLPLFWFLGMGAVYHLVLRYPAPRFNTSLPRWFYAAIYTLPVIAFFLLTLFLRLNEAIRPPLLVVVFIAILEVTLRFILHAEANPRRKQIIRYPNIAGFILIGALVAGAFIGEKSNLQALFAPMIIAPGLFFYPIIRYRLFDLYFVVRKNSIYNLGVILTDALAVIAILGCINAIANITWDFLVVQISRSSLELVRIGTLDPEHRVVTERSVLIVLSIACVALVWKGRNRIRKLLDRSFYRGSYDYRKALEQFTSLSTRIESVDVLSHSIVTEVKDILRVKSVAFALRENGCFVVHDFDGLQVADNHLPVNAPWCSALEDKRTSEAVHNLRDAERLQEAGVEFITPVFRNHEMVALVLLGEKRSETNYTRDDVELLNNLAVNIADALISMKYFEDAKEQVRLKRELEIARKIQLASLPADIPQFPGIDVAAISLPAYEVGGDFYDFLARHHSVTVVAGDISGKGTSAALYLARVQGIIRAIDLYEPSLWELFVRLNTQLFEFAERNIYLTLAALRIDLMNRHATFLRAGHLPMLHYGAASRSVIVHKPAGIGIGLDNNLFGERLKVEEIAPSIGDVFLLFSDGISEAVNPDGAEFGLQAMQDHLQHSAELSAEEIKSSLLDKIQLHTGDVEQHDDMTLVVVKF